MVKIETDMKETSLAGEEVGETYQKLLGLIGEHFKEKGQPITTLVLLDKTVLQWAKLPDQQTIHVEVKIGKAYVYFSVNQQGLAAFGFENLPLVLDQFPLLCQADVSLGHLLCSQKAQFRRATPTVVRWFERLLLLNRFQPPPLSLG